MTEQTCESGGQASNRLTFWVLVYLFFPNAIFLIGWIKPVLAWPIVFLLILNLWAFWSRIPRSAILGVNAYTLILVLVAVAWSCFGGAGHLFHAKPDWIFRGPVLRDLAVASWPVSYGLDDGYPLILRCPLGYFLTSALLSKWLGIQSLDWLALLWTILGVTLFFMLLPLSRISWSRFALGLVVLIFFSGMDGLLFLMEGMIFSPNYHLEWWSWPYHYASNTTHLLWAPNHVLPAWLAAALFMRHWHSPDFVMILPLLLSLLPLWSPFAPIGLFPFAVFSVVAYHKTHEKWMPWKPIDLLGPILLVLVVGAYFLLDTGGIPTVPKVDPSDDFPTLMYRYLLFLLIEFLILAVVIWPVCRSAPLLLATFLLVLIPLGNFGPGNDWVSRTSIAPIFVLCWSILELIRTRSYSESPGRFMIIGLILLVGSLTPINEFYGAIVKPAWPFDQSKGLVQVLKERSSPFPKHYVAHLKGGWLEKILKSSDAGS
jgi:hypothetical protein